MISTPNNFEDLFADGEEVFKPVYGHNGGGVGLCLVWVSVDLDEEAIGAGGDGGFSENRRHLSEAAGFIAEAAGLLNTVSGIENDGAAKLFHFFDSGHIVDEAIVAEERSPFGQDDFIVAAGADFFHGIFHFVGGEELTLFYIYRFTSIGTGTKQIGLPAEECRDLKAIDDLGGRGGLVGFVDVGHNRQAGLTANSGEDVQPLFEARPAKAM